MEPQGLIIVSLLAITLLLALGYGALRAGLNDAAAFGAVCLCLATIAGCLLMIALYAESV